MFGVLGSNTALSEKAAFIDCPLVAGRVTYSNPVKCRVAGKLYVYFHDSLAMAGCTFPVQMTVSHSAEHVDKLSVAVH